MKTRTLLALLALSTVGLLVASRLALSDADAHEPGRFAVPDGGAGAPAPIAPPTDWDVNAPHGPGADVDFTVSEGTWMGLDVSPDGSKIVFDLLGDLYTIPVAAGSGPATATRLIGGVSWETDAHYSPDGKQILYTSDAGGNENLWTMNADGTGPKPVTKEEGDRWSDGVWVTPSAAGSSGEGWFVGRKRSIDTRSIGVQELWLMNVNGGGGTKLTTLDADPHAGESAFDADGHTLWFSTRDKRFEYNENVHQSMWELATLDMKTGERTTVTNLNGSAVRPTPNPVAGGPMAFITRDRLKTVLMLRYADGHLESLADDLDPDAMEAFELRSAYPRMDWSPDGKTLYFWEKGHINAIDVATKARRTLDFSAEVKTHITQAVRPLRRLPDDVQDARVVRWAAKIPGMGVVSSAMGTLWSVAESTGAATALTPSDTYAYFPQASADGKSLAYVTWDDRKQGQVWTRPTGAGFTKSKPRQVTLTAADYEAPAISPDGKSILYLRGTNTQDGRELGGEPSMDLMVATLDPKGVPADGTRLTTVPYRGSGGPSARPQWSPDGQRIYWLEDVAPSGRKPETAALVSVNRLGTDKLTHLIFPDGAIEARLSPDFGTIVAKIGWDAVVAPMPPVSHGTLAPPGFADLPQRKLTNTGATWLDWADNHTVTWTTGSEFYELDTHQKDLYSPPGDDKKAAPTPTPAAAPADAASPWATAPASSATEAPKSDAPKPDPLPAHTAMGMHIPVTGDFGTHTFAFTHAHILPMDGPEIADGTVVVTNRRITAVGADAAIPAGAQVIDLHGKALLPGLVDVHAHLHYASGDIHPNQEWRHLVNLAYGVTTVFDPSAANDLVFGQAEEIQSGRMDGPRVLSTGNILYGALDNQSLHAKSYEDAENAVKKQQLVGAWGVKSYQQSHRSHRQWIVEACRKLGMLDVPEGGGDIWQNLSMILDGHSSIEHALPVAPMYDDVTQLWKRSDTTWTPTLLVAYGGPFGELEGFTNERVYDDPKLSKWTPPWVLISRAYRLDPVLTDPGEYHHHLVAQEAAKLLRAGVRVVLGAHGQLQGLGPHWELEALGGPGAMTPDEALHAATINGATHLGLAQDIGSITVGKIADLFIVDGDPEKDLKDARKVVYVMKDGRLWDADSMQELPANAARKKLGWMQ